MEIKRRIGRNLHWLVAVMFALAVFHSRAATVDVYWDSTYGFYTSHVTINAGDEVDFWNLDVDYDGGIDLILRGAPPPANFYVDIPPSPDGFHFWIFPYTYNNPGTYSASDEFAESVTITVNSTTPTPLSVTISDPTNNAAFTAPATFTVTAVPADGATPYQEVDFFVGTNFTGVAYASPFTATVTNLPVGNYTISAVVTDSSLNTATNSILVSVVPPPSLTATRAGNQIVISWPTNNPSGISLSLQSATNLGPAASWTPVDQIPASIGNQWVVTNPISGSRQFFRLSSQ